MLAMLTMQCLNPLIHRPCRQNISILSTTPFMWGLKLEWIGQWPSSADSRLFQIFSRSYQVGHVVSTDEHTSKFKLIFNWEYKDIWKHQTWVLYIPLEFPWQNCWINPLSAFICCATNLQVSIFAQIFD